jgi:hypothetical protein
MKIQKERIRIPHNPLNSFWNWLGQFQNCPEILIGGQWYRCGIRFIENDGKDYAVISDPMIVDKVTSRILKVYKNGEYLTLPVSSLRKQIITYQMNHHWINDKYNHLRKLIRERRNTIIVFAIATMLSLLYFKANELTENSLMTFIGKNNLVQTIIIFLTLSSFINIFYPFTIQKPIGEPEIREIIKRVKEEDERNAQIERMATL